MPQEFLSTIRRFVNRTRMLDLAQRLIAIPSRTGDSKAVLDDLAEVLSGEGFAVQREAADHPTAPAVLAVLDSGKTGKCLQFNGHVDVVHLPFVPPSIEGSLLKGSGACDMKGGLCAAIEAVLALRDSKLLERGRVLLCAHDLHEAPWGLGEQLDALIKRGVHGDAVLLPEPLTNHLPISGRGNATWKVTFRRPGGPMHEVVVPQGTPNVIKAIHHLLDEIGKLDGQLGSEVDPIAGRSTVFVGQVHCGELYNQDANEGMIEGTRRWIPGRIAKAAENEFRAIVNSVATAENVTANLEWRHIRDAFQLDVNHPFVEIFQTSYARMNGSRLTTGPKAFVDDGNAFWGIAQIPAITHGPRAGGQHTIHEWIDIDDMERVAALYALTAIGYLNET
jgi:acetylornithine deacetylase/succinyl-diaminopimelate desuccinylase-like protein